MPRSSYYKWLNRQIPQKEKQDNELANLVSEYQKSFNGILGYRRMTMFINKLNHTNFSEKYIHRIMVATKMQARIRRKKYNYIKSKPEQTGENILSRDFTATAPNQKWCTDVTEFKILNQKRKVYLSAIMIYKINGISFIKFAVIYFTNLLWNSRIMSRHKKAYFLLFITLDEGCFSCF